MTLIFGALAGHATLADADDMLYIEALAKIVQNLQRQGPVRCSSTPQ